MPSSKKILVQTESDGQRLDVFLSENLEISRSQAQKMINAEQITLNGRQPKKTGEKIKEGDVLTLQHKNTETKIYRSEKTQKHEIKKRLTEEPKIIASVSDYIIVDKPSGILTHPTQANEKETLAAWLVQKFPEIKSIGEDPVRPGIVHRLDKEASGLLVVARTQQMFNHLKEQFKNRTIEKEYLTLVHGKVAKDWGKINFPISRSENTEKMAAVPKTVKGLPSDVGKEAVTEFFVEKRYVNFTLLKIKILTGRTHQIRAHLFAYNHPIVGDPLYFQKKQKRIWDEKCGRLFLHCTNLGFNDMEGTWQEFESQLPEELNLFIKFLK